MNLCFIKIFVFLYFGFVFCIFTEEIRKHPKNSLLTASSVTFYTKVLPTLQGKQVLLVTNPSGIGNSPEKIISKFKQHKVHIHSLLGLEHGFLGLEEDFSNSAVSIDPIFKLPVYHIYKLKPNELKKLLSEVEVILFDVQDVGMRCYTYLTVLKRLMDNMNESQEIIVLDHPSPSIHLGVKGDVVYKGYENFAGEFPLPLFTGLTMGESALYYNGEHLQGKLKVRVVKIENYSRKMFFERAGIVWNTPSPNLPTLDSARNYFALVLLEGVNVSVGRGTQAPFIYFGAPWITNPEALASALESDDYYFQPVFFRPTFSKYKDTICRGLRLEIVNSNYDPIELGYNLIKTLKAQYPEDFKWEGTKKFMIDNLWGSDKFRKAIDSKKSFREFQETYLQIEKEYSKKIEKYILYPK